MRQPRIEAGCIPKKHYRPKEYWCPELSALRDKKKFWWRLWVENNKPRHGPISDVLKSLKKKFRKVSRKCIMDQKKNKFYKLNSLFADRKLPQFWNKIKMQLRNSPNSTLKPEGLCRLLLWCNGYPSGLPEHRY